MKKEFYEKLRRHVGKEIMVSRGFKTFKKVKLLWVDRQAVEITVGIKNPETGKIRIVSGITEDEVKFPQAKVRKRSRFLPGGKRLVVYSSGDLIKISVILKDGTEKVVFEDDEWYNVF